MVGPGGEIDFSPALLLHLQVAQQFFVVGQAPASSGTNSASSDFTRALPSPPSGQLAHRCRIATQQLAQRVVQRVGLHERSIQIDTERTAHVKGGFGSSASRTDWASGERRPRGYSVETSSLARRFRAAERRSSYLRKRNLRFVGDVGSEWKCVGGQRLARRIQCTADHDSL